MIKRFRLIVLIAIALLVLPFAAGAQEAGSQPKMRDVFAQMPDSVLPAVSKNNRLDCIDFIENNLEAKVRNAFDDYVELEALTTDYARFRSSASSVMEMKLLPKNDTTSVLCVVTTAECGEVGTAQRLEDSNVSFLRPDWSPLAAHDVEPLVPSLIPLAFFLGERPESAADDYEQALRALDDFRPIRVTLSAEAPVATLTLQTAQLSKEERTALGEGAHTLLLRWQGNKFIP